MPLLRHLYYELKPFLPLGLRMAFRRHLASGIRRGARGVWPIKHDTSHKPSGWAGWPEGKQFGLILTHDIESAEGVSRCRALAELELEFGLRSSFNFIPEGTYETPADLRRFLIDRGFEVGVHDLHHNGKLYRSESDFYAAAEKINGYLSKWGAVGFRSGFMHHNLDWLHALNIQYDLSTFDTDPFEPQPDGVDTIFPFWVSAPVDGAPRSPVADLAKGYVEMPYTLPQDSTLFLVLREPGIGIWKSKLDWIAQHGGMALLNVHPDYMTFGGDGSAGPRYPSAFYREFLAYFTERYRDVCWAGLPREGAAYVRKFIQPLASC